jgi:hypothetical protein
MTITKIRVIHETEAKMALEKGIISVHERNCLQRTLGHSERTAEKYYCPKDRLLDSEVASGAMQKIASMADIPTDPQHDMKYEEFPSLPPPHATPFPEMKHFLSTPPLVIAHSPSTFQNITSRRSKTLNLAEWGLNHPDRRPEAIRVRWTAEEEAIVADFLGMFPMATLKECYDYVVQSIHAKDVFHPNHICSHTRLEHAFKKVKKILSSAAIMSMASPSSQTYEE